MPKIFGISMNKYLFELYLNYITMFFVFVCLFLAFDFCQFCVVIRFFHPQHNGQ